MSFVVDREREAAEKKVLGRLVDQRRGARVYKEEPHVSKGGCFRCEMCSCFQLHSLARGRWPSAQKAPCRTGLAAPNKYCCPWHWSKTGLDPVDRPDLA